MLNGKGIPSNVLSTGEDFRHREVLQVTLVGDDINRGAGSFKVCRQC